MLLSVQYGACQTRILLDLVQWTLHLQVLNEAAQQCIFFCFFLVSLYFVPLLIKFSKSGFFLLVVEKGEFCNTLNLLKSMFALLNKTAKFSLIRKNIAFVGKLLLPGLLDYSARDKTRDKRD